MDLIEIFEKANFNMMDRDRDLFYMRVSERTLCGALMLHLNEVLKQTEYRDYFVDVEYNRNKGGKLKTCVKTINYGKETPIKINCDLIVHSRGNNIQQDNLIAIEMKKSTQQLESKMSDRHRIMALTMDSYDDIWSYDGKTLPEHVCRYKLGVYYEINFKEKMILLEYYAHGNQMDWKNIYYQ